MFTEENKNIYCFLIFVSWVSCEGKYFYSSYILVYYPPLNIWSANTPSYSSPYKKSESICNDAASTHQRCAVVLGILSLFALPSGSDSVKSNYREWTTKPNPLLQSSYFLASSAMGFAIFCRKLTKLKNPDIPHFCQSLKNITVNVWKSLKPSGSMTPSVSFPQMTVDCWREEVTNGWIKILHTRYENMAYHQHYRLLKWVWKSRELEIWKLTVFSKK